MELTSQEKTVISLKLLILTVWLSVLHAAVKQDALLFQAFVFKRLQEKA